jgi:hypothetical protein
MLILHKTEDSFEDDLRLRWVDWFRRRFLTTKMNTRDIIPMAIARIRIAIPMPIAIWLVSAPEDGCWSKRSPCPCAVAVGLVSALIPLVGDIISIRKRRS